jgi:uncharacterized membrane protein YdjX (TVP38/TMEM64 family)
LQPWRKFSTKGGEKILAEEKTGKGGLWIRLLIIAAVAGGAWAVFRFTPLSLSQFTPDKVKQFVQRFGVLSPLVFMIIYALRAVILVLPVGIMSLAGGLAFGKWLGTVYILIGATAGACLSFLMARYLGRGFIEKLGVMKKGRLKTFDQGVEKNGFRVILFVRLIPLFQYDAVNFGSGLSKMKFRDYFMGTLIGMIPGGFINALLGSSLENIISVQFFAALGFFILLMFVPAIYKKIKKGRAKKEERAPVPSKRQRGSCPDCGLKIGPLSIFRAWDTWGRFLCPACGNRIAFRWWLAAAAVLAGLFVLIERLVRYLIGRYVPDYRLARGPLWLIFLLACVLSMAVMMVIPRIWRFYSLKKQRE